MIKKTNEIVNISKSAMKRAKELLPEFSWAQYVYCFVDTGNVNKIDMIGAVTDDLLVVNETFAFRKQDIANYRHISVETNDSGLTVLFE